MIRRHSVCLSDIPYDYDYDYSSYESPDDDANADPNDTITFYTLRRASSPVMTSSYNAGRAVDMTTPAPRMSSTAATILAGDAHEHDYGYGHGLPRAGKKPKKKKPKKNKRSKTKDKKEDNSPESVHSAVTVTDIAESSTTTTTVGDNSSQGQGQGQPISAAPLIVNGANWNWKQKQMSEVRPPSSRTFTFIHFLHRIQANSPSRLATTSMMQTTVCSASSARTIPRCT